MAGLQLGQICRHSDGTTDCCGGGAPVAATVTLPSCFCQVPTTISLVNPFPDCDYEMFQPCSIVYGPLPAELQTGPTTASGFTSPQRFVDPLSGLEFFYYFWCRNNQFMLTRFFPNWPDAGDDGGPGVYRDSVLYTWVVGNGGNTCDPFALLRGTPYPGSGCVVGINGAPVDSSGTPYGGS